ncbi:class I SAM-dependent methyltransferase [Streptomyces sp. NPDC048269]|uniref:SAM-dependent methyltransferase n=1 Tax=Streptomyces sp. NPDC048269 TaxID=3155753 RepID=UPI00341A9F8C
MNREMISLLAHTRHPIAAPLSDRTVHGLLERGLPRGDERVLDLGCGGGEWLLRCLEMHEGVHAHGVDISEPALDRARSAADRLAVGDRLTLHQVPAAEYVSTDPFDLVLSVGAAHAFDGLLPTLEAAGKHLAPGGHILIGDGYWQQEPSAGAVEMLGDFADLATTLDNVTAAGWTPVFAHVSSREELDAYEWSWTGSLAAWALDHPEDPAAREALATSADHRREWLNVYREPWGFLTLLLRANPTR